LHRLEFFPPQAGGFV